MKKSICGFVWLLALLTVFFPLGTLISDCFGYTFEFTGISVFAVITAVVSVCAAFVLRETIEDKTAQIILAVITPLSLVNAVFYIFECSRILVVASVLVSAGCCCFLSVKHGKPIVLTVVSLVLSVLMLLPVGFISFIALIFGNIGQNTVVKTIESPRGTYYAQVVDSDQGALGGDTFVDVYETSGINAVFFKITKKPQRVYHGEWGAYKDMDIYWKGEYRLVINSVEHKME